MSSLQPVKFDKYILLDKIAVGGMAEVYRAKLVGEKGFEKPVVLKKLFPHLDDEKEMVSHFINEARLAAQLKHENIVDIYDFGKESGSFFIAMEYLFGKDLSQVIHMAREKEQPIDLENILYIVLKVCEGLGYAHSLKDLAGNALSIIHRDVSPQNVFLTYSGQVKLIDFGIAKAASMAAKTQTGIIKGKVAYMSPEQAGGKTVDHRSDIFAVGIILYELATRKKMFEGDTFQVLSQVIAAKYEPPENITKELPERLYHIINKALCVNPDERYQTCEELGADIEDCIYELKYRPGAKKLSGYLQSLYLGQYDVEKRNMAQTLQYELPEAMSRAVPENYQPTEAIRVEEQVDAAVASYEPTEVMQSASHGVAAKAEILEGGGKKRLAIFGILFILLLIVLSVGYFTGFGKKTSKFDSLVAAAAKSLAENRIISPDNDNSIYYYQEALKLQPDNEIARQGLRRVVLACVAGAENKIQEGDASAAERFIQAGLRIEPNNQSLAGLRKKLNAKKLLAWAGKSLTENRIIKPLHNNAIYYYQEALRIDPDNKNARAGLRKVVVKCIVIAGQALQALEYSRAGDYIQAGLRLEPDNQYLLELQDRFGVLDTLKAAEKSLADKRIISPPDDNALYYYREVLSVDANNEAARAGLQKVVATCATTAEEKMRERKYSSAIEYIQAGLTVDPENQQLLKLEKRIEIEKLLAAAEESESDKRITGPTGDNAAYYYQEVLKHDPANDAALEGLQRIVAFCIHVAEDAMDELRFPTAQKYIQQGLAIDPDNKRLLQLELEVADKPGVIFDKVKDILAF